MTDYTDLIIELQEVAEKTDDPVIIDVLLRAANALNAAHVELMNAEAAKK